MIFFVKSVHIVIFLFNSLCAFYVLYCGIFRKRGFFLKIAIAAILIEGIILFFSDWVCPLTTLAIELGDEKGYVADIIFPDWFLPYVFPFFGSVFALGILLLIFNRPKQQM